MSKILYSTVRNTIFAINQVNKLWLKTTKKRAIKRFMIKLQDSVNKILLVVISFVLVLLFSTNGFSQSELYQVNTLVIDPGHGGKDPGAVSQYGKEKDVVLAIGLKLRKLIEDSLPDVNVIMTRDKDVFIELYRRAKIANENKADLFISIHANSNESSKPRGSETYVMGLYKTKANLAVAKKENQVVLQEADYQQQYDGFDPNSPEGNIIFSLYQNAFLAQSLQMADLIQKHFHQNPKLIDRGVKQAGFLVLWKTAMPSLLVETGFISNKTDGNYLFSTQGQDSIVLAIFQAFKEYKLKMEGQAIKDGNPPEEKPDLDKGLVYSIQVLTTKKVIPLQPRNFNEFSDVYRKISGVWNKYYIGAGLNIDDISEKLKDVKKYY
ncbi:MAG: N-acetylmuramoyl-L-alanine amidase, partial [Bacteroidales bacterium]|nr:N-acetylmuramoyl-L-alanine amidase [Bacteroidales bacterium]